MGRKPLTKEHKQKITDGKKRRDKCLQGQSHGIDTWLMAELIVSGRLNPKSISPKALECAVNDLRNKKGSN